MKKLSLLAATLLAATPAAAHHPLAGAPMETFTHGLLSGIGHPILGFDHLFFIVLMGIAAVLTGRALAAPLAFIATMLIGTLLVSFGVSVPGIEPMVVLSLLVLGYVMAMGRGLSFGGALALFAVAGLFHGAAFGGSIAEQEAAVGGGVLIGYLLGLGIAQYAIAVGAGLLAQRLWASFDASAIQPRLAGAVVGGMGLFLALETLEGAAFAALGIG